MGCIESMQGHPKTASHHYRKICHSSTCNSWKHFSNYVTHFPCEVFVKWYTGPRKRMVKNLVAWLRILFLKILFNPLDVLHRFRKFRKINYERDLL